MKRLFINQDGFFNKFWNIEIREETQIITFGKIGSQGRQTTKEFETKAECQKETEKLISQKIKKGYTEIFDQKYIPEKIPLTDDEAGELFFWNSIEKANKHKNSHWSEYDIDEHLQNLTESLSKSAKQKLMQFEKCLQENLHKLYTAEIAEFYILLTNDFQNKEGQIIFEDYISEDGFIYFRCWILLQGKSFFDDIQKDISNFVSGKYGVDIGDTWAEGLLYVADEAYSINHENEDDSEIRVSVEEMYPEVIHYDSAEREMNRSPIGGAELQEKYPEMVREIVRLKT